MKKVYNQPRLTVENMDFSLLVEVSSIPVKDGTTGSFDAKGLFDFEEEEDEDDEE